MDSRLYNDQVLRKYIGKQVSVRFYKPNGEEDRAEGLLQDYSELFVELVNNPSIKTLLPVRLINKIYIK
jgi:hypothetical protein